jgi:hypothetical protein
MSDKVDARVSTGGGNAVLGPNQEANKRTRKSVRRRNSSPRGRPHEGCGGAVGDPRNQRHIGSIGILGTADPEKWAV